MHGFFERRLLDDLASCGIEHLLLTKLSFVVVVSGDLAGRREVDLFIAAGRRAASTD